MRPALSERIARHNADNADREHQENERVKRAVEHRRVQEEFLKWKEEMKFSLHLTALQILMRLEEIRDAHQPAADGEWDSEFRTAIELIPEARRFAEDSMMECIKEDYRRYLYMPWEEVLK